MKLHQAPRRPVGRLPFRVGGQELSDVLGGAALLAVSAAAAASILLPAGRPRSAAMLFAVVCFPALILADQWNSAQISTCATTRRGSSRWRRGAGRRRRPGRRLPPLAGVPPARDRLRPPVPHPPPRRRRHREPPRPALPRHRGRGPRRLTGVSGPGGWHGDGGSRKLRPQVPPSRQDPPARPHLVAQSPGRRGGAVRASVPLLPRLLEIDSRTSASSSSRSRSSTRCCATSSGTGGC